MNDYESILRRTRTNIARFEKLEGRSWGPEGAVIELAKQVGDLAALVMTKEHYYMVGRADDNPKYAATKEKLADELADILLVVQRLADIYDIDLLAAQATTREQEDQFLRSKGV